MDNFLSEAELDYFDQKIQSKVFSFQRSFVDNMDNIDNMEEYNNSDDGVEEEEEDEKNSDAEEGNSDSDSADAVTVPAPTTAKKKRKRKRKRATATILDDTHRTSTFYPFRKLQDTRVAALEHRIASLLGCWLVRYEPGQFFGVHHDMGDLKDDDTVALPPKSLATGVKRRLVTLFCYLNSLEDDQGGATHFPKCGNLRVKPKRGRAVLWSNVTEDGQPDERTIHAGETVIDNSRSRSRCCKPEATDDGNDDGAAAKKGKRGKKNKQEEEQQQLVKYGLNIWICEE
ncbi:MAG: hypothetical protein SGARI_001318 [Bacillariaceae sp.]